VKRDFGQSIGSSINEPLGSITAGGAGKADLVMSYITKLKGTNIGDSLDAPLHTVTAGGLHFGAISAFLVRYHGAENGGHSIEKPLGTITTKDEFGLVIVVVDGEQYVITDICMRMLTPRELYRAQGFPDWYIIEYGHDGKKFTKATQVNNVGNSVPPLWAAQIFGHNVLSAEEIEELWQEVA
jgi:DNA (cytosine-5)-methyltransferase 1